MSYGELFKIEEEKTSKKLSYAIFALWILTFVFNAIAISMIYGAGDIVRKLYMRTLLELQAQVLVIQAVSAILWFIISTYILISALYFEERDKYNIGAGILFFISGVAELILAILMIQVSNELSDMATRLPLYDINEMADKLMTIQDKLILYSTMGNIILSLSIGGAFILIGLNVIKYANRIIERIDKAYAQYQLVQITTAPIPPSETSTIKDLKSASEALPQFPQQQDVGVGSVFAYLLSEMRKGASRMKTGGKIYVASGVLDILSILVPSLGSWAFLLFIVGIFVIGSGRKRLLRAQQALLYQQKLASLQPQEGSRPFNEEF